MGKHAKYSPSSGHRYMNCPPALLLEEQLLFTHITVTEIKELRQDSEIFRKFVMESHLVPE